MAAFNYVLVTEENFRNLALTANRTKLKSGYYLLNQKDFSGQAGETLWEKVSPYGGIIVSEAEAHKLMSGTINPPKMEVKETDGVEAFTATEADSGKKSRSQRKKKSQPENPETTNEETVTNVKKEEEQV